MGFEYTEQVGSRKAATAITMMATDLMESPLANSLALLVLPDSPLRARSIGKEKGGQAAFKVGSPLWNMNSVSTIRVGLEHM
jgi:hypothetical protein